MFLVKYIFSSCIYSTAIRPAVNFNLNPGLINHNIVTRLLWKIKTEKDFMYESVEIAGYIVNLLKHPCFPFQMELGNLYCIKIRVSIPPILLPVKSTSQGTEEIIPISRRTRCKIQKIRKITIRYRILIEKDDKTFFFYFDNLFEDLDLFVLGFCW